MKAAVISLGSTSSQWTIDAMKKVFEDVEKIDLRDIEIKLGKKDTQILYAGHPLKHYDCIYAKGSFRYANLLRTITTLRRGENCYMPISASSFTDGNDKLMTQIILEKAGVPTPKTYLSSTTKAAKELLKSVIFPIVMKFPQGTHGKGVMFADSIESATSMLDALEALNQPFVLQEFIDTGGKDVRAFVVGGKVVAAMERVAKEGEKRSNVHAGGSSRPIELDAESKRIAVKAARAMGCAICGVDLLQGPRGPLVIEINVSPGLQGITKATNIDVAGEIAQFLHKETQNKVYGEDHRDAGDILKDLGISKNRHDQKFITSLDFRGERIFLPQVITQVTKFNDGAEYEVTMKEGHLEIRPFVLDEEKE